MKEIVISLADAQSIFLMLLLAIMLAFVAMVPPPIKKDPRSKKK